MNYRVENEFDKIKRTYSSTTPHSLAEEAHYKILYADLDKNTGGCTITNSRCSTIIVNRNWEEHYLNFVILHEFSHLKLHGGESAPFYRNIGLDTFIPKMEREANSLALKILISMQDMTEIQGLTKYQLLNYLGLPFQLEFFLK
ncbi:ImmA/IrrE family metallo-endopeptidase [Liquorilactobacillus satsumensis]|uniref:ImmA/IrrE family metallo-endopeptidase n=1 Tax=Liquorilactobacillus TaxID=2767888 RepID=UPI001E5F2DE8|nr:ImmA/IrrE family metallo-endopeptidase [Liquorilactobacillus satsumensis]MCC7667473.1 toxin-antitoxin system toxin subunit [Liquorilactobacillus satsumensis]MCP9357939.1 ImmA/IrrE family metallo-endopeptidase [Liquorilactobacillus satsumensis]MCP9371633.1 ImmA/IrrE family metallo-endopeptidase [Liquorilactobacillus satsumensis]